MTDAGHRAARPLHSAAHCAGLGAQRAARKGSVVDPYWFYSLVHDAHFSLAHNAYYSLVHDTLA